MNTNIPTKKEQNSEQLSPSPSPQSSFSYSLQKLDGETIERLNRVCKNSSEYINLLANEPSIGLYHVEHHIQKSVPKLVQVKKEFKTLDTKVNETGYDMDYALRTIKGLHECTTFSTISLLLEQSSKAADEIVKRGYTYSGTNKINTNKIDPSNPTNIPQIERTTSKNSLTPISPSSANKLDVLTSFNEGFFIFSIFFCRFFF